VSHVFGVVDSHAIFMGAVKVCMCPLTYEKYILLENSIQMKDFFFPLIE
jgi:hypothetical protein